MREIPGLQIAGGEESILKEYHCISPGSIPFLLYIEGWAVGLFQDTVLFWENQTGIPRIPILQWGKT